MAKVIAICNAKGQVGDLVTRSMLKENWRVRAVTHDVKGKVAKSLKKKGAELVCAHLDDEASLAKAFEVLSMPFRLPAMLTMFRQDVDVVFTITQYWANLHLGLDKAVRKEHEQMLGIANAAAKLIGLEHVIMLSLTPIECGLDGSNAAMTPWRYEETAADKIRFSLPDLASKTTFLRLGWSEERADMVVSPSPVVRLAAEGDLSDNADTSQQPSTYILTSPYRTRTSKFRSEIEHIMPILIRGVLTRPEFDCLKRFLSTASDNTPLGQPFLAKDSRGTTTTPRFSESVSTQGQAFRLSLLDHQRSAELRVTA